MKKQKGIFMIVFLALYAAVAMAPSLSMGEEIPAKLTADQLADIAARPDVLAELAAQPDLIVSHDAHLIPNEHGGFWVNTEVAIPLPAELGGGYLVGTEEALKAGLAAIGDEATDSAYSTLNLTIKAAGKGSGTVTSNPKGINCGKTCTASFDSAKTKKVVLYAAPAASSYFAGWSGGPCTGTKSCTINQITGNITVTATFTTYGVILVTPDKRNFIQKTQVGKTSAAVFTVTNIGKNTLTMGAITLAGTSAGQFSLAKDKCSNKAIPYSNSCTFWVNFKPVAEGEFSDTVNVPSNDPNQKLVTVPISGGAIAK